MKTPEERARAWVHEDWPAFDKVCPNWHHRWPHNEHHFQCERRTKAYLAGAEDDKLLAAAVASAERWQRKAADTREAVAREIEVMNCGNLACSYLGLRKVYKHDTECLLAKTAKAMREGGK